MNKEVGFSLSYTSVAELENFAIIVIRMFLPTFMVAIKG